MARSTAAPLRDEVRSRPQLRVAFRLTVDFRDFKEGDIIEAYTMEEIATTIADANKAAAKKAQEQLAAAAAKAKDAEKD